MPVNVKAINDERLGRWKNQLNRKHATPFILLGIGHDHNVGNLVILCTEERSDEDILLGLEKAVLMLKEQISQKN